MYILGAIGIIFNRKEIIRVLISIELMLIGVTLYILMSSVEIDDMIGEVMSIIILTVAAAESVIGLGIVIGNNRIGKDSKRDIMKG